MRVLFVDDEVRVLEAIERVLFELDTDWETHFVNNGERALAELEQHPFDVIVSDMRMPGMDGVTLLTKVCELYPRTVRIVLSGQTDEEAALKMVRVAHQFLAKPCGAETLFRVISRTSELNALLGDKRLQAIVGQVGALASPPSLYSELSALLERDDTNAAALARVIKQDPAMTSKLLQVANSAFFNSSASVADVDTAIMRLGFRTLRNLMLGIGAFESAKISVDASFSVDKLQQRSLAIARLASSMVSQPEDASAAFMAGLMCNIGQLVLATVAPERLYLAQAEAERSGVAPHAAERATWGVTHAELGAFLLGLWGIPFQIVEAVANHHAPERNAHDRFALPQVVWLASCVVEAEAPDSQLLERFHAVDIYAKHLAAYAGKKIVSVPQRVLCVDDEPLVLEGLERTLSDNFDVVTESRPLVAIELLGKGKADFDVIISDMRMPLMDGARFLAKAAELAPEAARILLTGHAELQAAIDAVNDGRIFRFLCKPCPPAELVAAVEAGAEQRRLRNVERELLEETLTGSIRLLSDVLALVSPNVFSRTQRIQAYVVHIANKIGRKDVWRFELAASLLMIGCVGLPEETLQRALNGTPLDPEERQAFDEHPDTAYRLLSRIPRFEAIAQMIRLQQEDWSPGDVTPDVALGARILNVARTIDRMVQAGETEPDAVAKALPKAAPAEIRLLKALEDFRSALHSSSVLRNLRVSQMTPQMVLEQDVRTTLGVVVVPSGRALTHLLIERLLRFSVAGTLEEPVCVRVPG